MPSFLCLFTSTISSSNFLNSEPSRAPVITSTSASASATDDAKLVMASSRGRFWCLELTSPLGAYLVVPRHARSTAQASRVV